jgi:regulator of extracellular matrix RemA (YlzA/DUF370 family)
MSSANNDNRGSTATGHRAGVATSAGPALLNIGFGNVVLVDRVIAVVNPGSAPMKRLREEARIAGKLIDATQGRKTRAVVITDSDHVILSAIQADTVAQRLRNGRLVEAGDDLGQ